MPTCDNVSDAVIDGYKNTIRDQFRALPYYQQIASRGIANGATGVTSSKNTIETTLALIKADTATRRACIQAIANDNSLSSEATTDLADQINRLKPVVDTQTTVYTLRQEQATALANKYASSSYSSWWLLWAPLGDTKPLSDVTRATLYIFSAVSLLVCGASFFLKRAPPAAGVQEGGSRSRQRRVEAPSRKS
jgi:hypothetical protein